MITFLNKCFWWTVVQVFYDAGTGDKLLDGNFTQMATTSLNYGTLDYQRLIFHRTRFINRVGTLSYFLSFLQCIVDIMSIDQQIDLIVEL
jgi:hypothetical protein